MHEDKNYDKIDTLRIKTRLKCSGETSLEVVQSEVISLRIKVRSAHAPCFS